MKPPNSVEVFFFIPNAVLNSTLNLFSQLWKAVDAVNRLIFLHVHKRSVTLLLAGCFLSSFVFWKRLKPQGLMSVEYSKFPIASVSGLWQWQPYGHMHCHVAHLVDACKNTTIFVNCLYLQIVMFQMSPVWAYILQQSQYADGLHRKTSLKGGPEQGFLN